MIFFANSSCQSSMYMHLCHPGWMVLVLHGLDGKRGYLVTQYQSLKLDCQSTTLVEQVEAFQPSLYITY